MFARQILFRDEISQPTARPDAPDEASSNHVVRCTEVNSLATGFNLEAYLASVLELDTTTMALTFIK